MTESITRPSQALLITDNNAFAYVYGKVQRQSLHRDDLNDLMGLTIGANAKLVCALVSFLHGNAICAKPKACLMDAGGRMDMLGP